MGEVIDSDAYYLKEPVNNRYRTQAAYCPAFGYIIDIFNAIPLPGVVGRDERAYYRYALENYTSIPQEYEQVIDNMIIEQDWYEEEINQVDSIAAYVSGLGECSLFNDEGGVDVNSYLNSQKKSKDPVMTLINEKKGSDLDFNTTAVMLFRRLHIPARLVEGYVSIGSQRGENSLSLFNRHYWCEIYVKGTGWMICDCMDMSAVTGTNPYAGLDQQNTPLENNHILERISVKTPTVTKHYLGDPLKTAGGYITAYFSDNTTSRVTLSNSTPGVRITGYDNTQVGEQFIDVSYTYEGVTKSSGWTVTVVEQDAKLINVIWNTDAAKKSYYQSEGFSLANITAIGQYDDGSERDLSDRIRLVNYDGTDNVGGPYQAVVSVTDTDATFSTYFEYTVVARDAISVTITQLPDKLSYYVGEQLDVSGMIVEVEYKNGSKQTIRLEGQARHVDPGLVEFSMTQFMTTNAHQSVDVMKYNSELGAYVKDTFEVEVKENDMQSYEAIGFKDDYTLGEYFDVDEFKSNGFIVAHMKNGYKIRISDHYIYEDEDEYDININTPFTIVAPTLDVVTSTKVVTIYFDYNEITYNVEVPINIKAYGAADYIFDEHVGVTAGPGATGYSNYELFNFTTDHVGTIYFRNQSYDTYSPKGWYNMYSQTTASSYHPNSFVFEKARQIYNTSSITINYTSSVPHGVSPYYSDDSGLDNYVTESTLGSGDSGSYSFANFEFTSENLARVSSDVITRSGVNSSNEIQYRNNFLDRFGDDNSNAYEAIENYINKSGHQYRDYYYSYSSNVYSKVDVINRVKSDLHSEFSYDPAFRYTSSDVDPVASFFNQGVGSSKQFATAATLIFRHLGMKARYVSGFGANSNGGTTSVYSRNAHSWCEVYFEGAGWIIVDPTYFDTGATSGSIGNYGAGFGGAGLYNFDKPIYSGVVSVSYDYAAQFTEDTEVPLDDPSRWYTVYDDKDHTHVYTISLEAGSNQLPSYLEYRVAFDWYRNDVYLGTYYSTDKVPTVSYGQYRLVPHVVVYDKAAQCEVTGEHNYTLKYGTEDMEFYIQPAFVYVYVYGTKDSYSMNGTGTVTLYVNSSNPSAGDLTYTLEVPEGAEYDIYSDLPSTIKLVISGYFEYVGEGGTIVIAFDNVSVEPNGATYSGQYVWDEFNVITFVYYGEVVITP